MKPLYAVICGIKQFPKVLLFTDKERSLQVYERIQAGYPISEEICHWVEPYSPNARYFDCGVKLYEGQHKEGKENE